MQISRLDKIGLAIVLIFIIGCSSFIFVWSVIMPFDDPEPIIDDPILDPYVAVRGVVYRYNTSGYLLPYAGLKYTIFKVGMPTENIHNFHVVGMVDGITDGFGAWNSYPYFKAGDFLVVQFFQSPDSHVTTRQFGLPDSIKDTLQDGDTYQFGDTVLYPPTTVLPNMSVSIHTSNITVSLQQETNNTLWGSKPHHNYDSALHDLGDAIYYTGHLLILQSDTQVSFAQNPADIMTATPDYYYYVWYVFFSSFNNYSNILFFIMC